MKNGTFIDHFTYTLYTLIAGRTRGSSMFLPELPTHICIHGEEEGEGGLPNGYIYMRTGAKNSMKGQETESSHQSLSAVY